MASTIHDRAEQVRQVVAARRRTPLSRDVERELVVRDDTSCNDGLFAVVQECLEHDFPEENLWRVDDDVQPLLFSFEAFRLGGSLQDMGKKWSQILIAVLRNSGSDPLGC